MNSGYQFTVESDLQEIILETKKIMINFNYHTNLYPCFSNYFGIKYIFSFPNAIFNHLYGGMGTCFSTYIHIFMYLTSVFI